MDDETYENLLRRSELRSQQVLNPNDEPCARCGQIAVGSAFIGGERYCHGNAKPSCYELTSWQC